MKAAGENLVILLLYSLLVGAFLGVLWDVFRILRIIAYGKRNAVKSLYIPLPATEKGVAKALSVSHTQNFLSLAGILIFISDILFSLTATVSLILLIFQVNNGEIRGTALIGTVIGFSVYYFTVGRLTVLFSDLIIRFIKKILAFFLKFTVIPVANVLFKPLKLVSAAVLSQKRKLRTEIFIKKRIKAAKNGFGLKSSRRIN